MSEWVRNTIISARDASASENISLQLSYFTRERQPMAISYGIPEGRKPCLRLWVPAFRHNPDRKSSFIGQIVANLASEEMGSTTEASGSNSGLCWSEQTTCDKGTPPMRKIDFFRALPKLPPPLPPIWASCTTIFGRQKQRLVHITEPRVKKIGQGPPPPFSGNARKKSIFIMGGVP